MTSEVVNELVRQMKYKEPASEKQITATQYKNLIKKIKDRKAKKEAYKRLVNKSVLKKTTRPTLRLKSNRLPEGYKSIYFKV